MGDFWVIGAFAAPILAIGIIEIMVRRALAKLPHQKRVDVVSYHLAIGGAVAGGPMVITVLDGVDLHIRKKIVLDWGEWRACEAGTKLQEHGYAILGSSLLDARRMAGWAVLAGIGFAAEVQEIPVSPKPLGEMLQNAADAITEAIRNDPETEQRLAAGIFGDEEAAKLFTPEPRIPAWAERASAGSAADKDPWPGLPLNATPQEVTAAAAQMPPLPVRGIDGTEVRQRLERLARDGATQQLRAVPETAEDWTQTRADVPVKRRVVPCEKDHPGTPACEAGPHWGVVLITREEWEAIRPDEPDE